MANARSYVLRNSEVHERRMGIGIPLRGFDAFSSAALSDRWQLTSPARTWLLAVGWRKARLPGPSGWQIQITCEGLSFRPPDAPLGQQAAAGAHDPLRTVADIDASTATGPVPWNAILSVLGGLPTTIMDRLSLRVQDTSPLAADIAARLAERHQVTLNGSVDSRRTKRLAEDVAERCAGVVDVHNRLRIADRASDLHIGKASE